MKTCSKCKIEKNTSEFYKDKYKKDGYKSYCINCQNEYKEKNKHIINNYKNNNSNKIKEYQKEWRDKNKEKIKKYKIDNNENLKEYSKKYYLENKNKIQKYYILNKEKIKNKNNEYNIKNKTEIKLKKKKYYLENKYRFKKYQQNNKNKIRDYNNNYKKNKMKYDPLYKLSRNISTLISNCIRKQGYRKNSKSHKILGCSFIEFKIFIESKFEINMSWDNYGKWHLDHIKPISMAQNETEIIELNHYSNFKPMWAFDNISKGNRFIG